MRRVATLGIAGLVAIAIGGLAIAGVNRNFSVHASGDQEVPPVETRGQGQAIFHLSKDGTSIDYKLIASNIENITQAHIHFGEPGVNGPVVVWLYPEGPPPELIPGRHDGILAEGTFTAADFVGPLAGAPMSTLLEWMRTQQAYVNVHTSQHPPGEIRGNFR